MKVLYLDCFSGISGDMTIGALLDLGGSFEVLENELKQLKFSSEYDLSVEKVVKTGISSTNFNVILNEEYTRHHHEHRHYSDIVEIITNSDLNERVKNMALRVFEKIGRAEAKIHSIPFEKVHFHEVGAVDSIIDIVGACILIDHLGVEKIYSSPVPLGNGTIRIAHGLYPVPAPATLEIVKGIPIQSTEIQGELTTPTGAGFLAVLVDGFGPLPSLKVEKVGYGAGNKDFKEHPNVLRLMMGTI
ncbi:nickel pincer cofactor biosynthesis protein LarC [Halobacillus mangrovi]|uniref:TIGR00299 family protein n=1 Tax=Halobacillus mangrovi TaxID=402384 RepID=A0A1W5ZZI3_9BACI|nr:nickel pincer cofactor biosynthesis protein LarC [Halobacillus mangrovi]ARI78674.1 TIGR00299 family protein [Halobacillus mangrovi]